MSGRTPDGGGWFEGLDPDDTEGAVGPIAEGATEEPRDRPRLAVESGYAETGAGYYDRLHEAAVRTARDRAGAKERAADRQLVHAVRAMDDTVRISIVLNRQLARLLPSPGSQAMFSK